MYYQDYQEGFIDKMACELSVEGLEFKSYLLLIGRVALSKLFYTHWVSSLHSIIMNNPHLTGLFCRLNKKIYLKRTLQIFRFTIIMNLNDFK